MNTTAKILLAVLATAGIVYYFKKNKKASQQPNGVTQSMPVIQPNNTVEVFYNTPTVQNMTAEELIQQAVANGTVKTVDNSDPATWKEGDVVITKKNVLAIIS